MKKLASIILSIIVAASALTITAFAETSTDESVVSGLYYTAGGATFDKTNGTLTFVSSGTIQDPKLKAKYEVSETGALKLDAWYNVFKVPASVKKIIINENVTVTGRFALSNDCTIEGKDRDTSIIYGTTETRYSHNRGDMYGKSWDMPYKYSSIDVTADGKNSNAVVNVKNLTVQDPYGYCISGYGKGSVIHCNGVSMIDKRGGDQNNSDGFVGQDGSSLTDVYIETADDAVKVYHSIDMKDVKIKMLRNGAPIQFGWNADDDQDTVVNIDGLTVTSDPACKYYNLAVFSWVSNANLKTVDIKADNVNIDVPYADLFRLNPPKGTANVTMTNAKINTNKLGYNFTNGTIKINDKIVLEKEEETAKYESTALFGTPVIDGTIDPIWADAPSITLDKIRLGDTKDRAEFKLLWDEENLYVLAQVKANNPLNNVATGVWDNDCCEFFLDADNAKGENSDGKCDINDRHVLINYENKIAAFDNENLISDIVSKPVVTDDGYFMEVKIPFKMTVAEKNIIGFDAQIDSTNGTDSREAIIGWAGDKNIADKGPTSWGNVTLVKTAATDTVKDADQKNPTDAEKAADTSTETSASTQITESTNSTTTPSDDSSKRSNSILINPKTGEVNTVYILILTAVLSLGVIFVIRKVRIMKAAKKM